MCPSVVALIKDLNGNHVIQRCLNRLSSSNKQFIYNTVAANCVEVATHRHGCCVMQRCIDYATDQQKRQLVAVIVQNALQLVLDPFGNYVVQYILELNLPYITRQVIAQFMGHIADLSIQKFSSNVVEKCLQLAEPDQRTPVIYELIAADRLPQLLQDPYANYVLQRALTVSDPGLFNFLVECMRPHLINLRATSYGKRIYNKLVKKFPMLEVPAP